MSSYIYKKCLDDVFKKLFVNLESVVMNNPENVLSGSYSKCLKGFLLSFILANNYFRKCFICKLPWQ